MSGPQYELHLRFEPEIKQKKYKFLCFKSEELSDSQSIKSHCVKDNKQLRFSPSISLRNFLLHFSAGMFLSVGLFVLAMSLWSFSWKISTYTLFMEIKLDYTFFIIPAALLCFPTVIFTVLTKRHKLNYTILLFAIQFIASVLLFTALFVGTSYKLNYSNETEHLVSTIPTRALNFTLTNLYSESIDRIHQKFKCCGILGDDEFNDNVPESCCFQLKCSNSTVFLKGCLRNIQEDVAWHRNIAVGLCQVFILMYFFNASMVATIYTSDHFKLKRKRSSNT